MGTLELAKRLVYSVLCGGDYGRYMALRSAAVRGAVRFDLYERSAIRFVRSYLRPGDVAVDVGANLGAYTITMAEAVGRAGKVWAFEPMAEAFSLLRRNTARFSQVELHQIALSNRIETLEISVPFLFGDVPEVSLAGIGVTAGRVQRRAISTMTLDAYQSVLESLRFIKVDIEGHEPAFLRGAIETIKHYQPLVQFEANTPEALDEVQHLVADSFPSYAIRQLDPAGTLFAVNGTLTGNNFYLVPPRFARGDARR
jgi:FkbM family methyltransferase